MSCPICAHKAFWLVRYNHDVAVDAWRAEIGDVATYEWRLCRRCGNAYPSKQPDLRVLGRIWAVNRSVEGTDPASILVTQEHRRFISRVGAERSYRLFAPLANGRIGRFLDIACGLGETVRIFANNGWDAEGIDADPSTARVHQELGIRAHIGQFEETAVGTSYDIIHIAHAIYFITNPVDFLRKVHERLAPGGLFCVVLADFMANADSGLPSYAHTFYPTASSMRYALACAGFETIFTKRLSGSIFIAACPSEAATTPTVWPARAWLLYRTKILRYALLGRPYLLLRRAAKFLAGRR